MEIGNICLIDSDFVIELLSKNQKAIDFAEHHNIEPYISIITKAELIERREG